MSTRAVHEGLTVIEMPVSYRERVGRSKLNVVRDGTRFLSTILWTALEYNPVRVLGLVGLAALGAAATIAVALLLFRLQGVTSLGPWGVLSVFGALVLAVGGVSIFALGATFNYLVSLFHGRPIRQGLFSRPLFTPSLDRHFGWMGAMVGLGGLMLAFASLTLGLRGWEITRLWLWLLASALLTLMGIQLIISWIVMRVLEALSQRELRISADLPTIEERTAEILPNRGETA